MLLSEKYCSIGVRLCKGSANNPSVQFNSVALIIIIITIITRMLAINVSIPNGTVVRLEQLRSPQLRFQREQPTDAGVD